MKKYQKSISLSPLHTFQLPYSASEIITISKAEEVTEITSDYLVLGEGSNTIFTCDFARPILRLAIDYIRVVETDDAFDIRVGAGMNWHKLVRYTVEQNIPGLENLALIPGSVGAAPVQNIGAYGVEVAEFITNVTAWDRINKVWCELTREDCEFAYRDSLFKRHPKQYVITEVRFHLPKTWQPRLDYGALADVEKHASAYQIMLAVMAIRDSKLPNPKEIPNAGSFFKNPVVSEAEYDRLKMEFPDLVAYPAEQGYKLAAGWLIEKAGWKGFRRGDAGVHNKQALVLVNYGEAKGSEIKALSEEIQESIYSTFAVSLEAEVNII